MTIGLKTLKHYEERLENDLAELRAEIGGMGDRVEVAVEELIWELRGDYTILIVTHNMAQARRASEDCIFMLLGKVIEYKQTSKLFVNPSQKETADYIEGRYG